MLAQHCFHLELMFHSKLYPYYFLATLIYALGTPISHFPNLLYFLIHKMGLRQGLSALTLLKILASKCLNYQTFSNSLYHKRGRKPQLPYKMLFLDFRISLGLQYPKFIMSQISSHHYQQFQVSYYENQLRLLAYKLKKCFFLCSSKLNLFFQLHNLQALLFLKCGFSLKH
jgi:hypothetical protein